jgi:hypothetical protein
MLLLGINLKNTRLNSPMEGTTSNHLDFLHGAFFPPVEISINVLDFMLKSA